MYRIRLHGRGGQGMKTASRILGSAFFSRGFEVQDAPQYGAERRGAPISAYVRASRRTIRERGIVRRPDLIVLADPTLVPVATAGVLLGAGAHSVLLVHSAEAAPLWKQRLAFAGSVLALPGEPHEGAELRFLGATCAAAAARLVGVLPREALDDAIRTELAGRGAPVVDANLARAGAAWEALDAHAGCVREGPEAAGDTRERPDWVDLPFEAASVSAPDIHAAATSGAVRTGAWRTMRPVIDYDRCHGRAPSRRWRPRVRSRNPAPQQDPMSRSHIAALAAVTLLAGASPASAEEAGQDPRREFRAAQARGWAWVLPLAVARPAAKGRGPGLP